MEREIVLIHGAFAGPWCLENYAAFFRGRGWTWCCPRLTGHLGGLMGASELAGRAHS